MSNTTDTTPQAEPATQVIYKADVAVQFFPDRTTRVVVLIDDSEPDLIDTDGGDITDDGIASDALDAAERVVRSEMIIPTIDPVVVVTRHPDAATEIDVFGADDAHIINIDMGSAYDVTRLTADDTAAVTEDVVRLRDEAACLPTGHPARVLLLSVAADLEEQAEAAR